MSSAECDDAVDVRLDRLRHERLQHMALDRQLEPGHGGDLGGIAGRRKPELLAADEAARGFYTDDLAVRGPDAGYFAVLDDVDTAESAPRA